MHMSDWFDDDAAPPGAKKPARSGGHNSTTRQVRTSDRRLPGIADPAPTSDFDWDTGSSPEDENAGERMGELIASSEDDQAANESPESGEASVEFNRDKFYDGMANTGNFIESEGMATGYPQGAIAGKIVRGTAGAGKQVGKFLDSAADYADDAAHERHKKGDLKIINDKKDQQALDKINKGQGKHGSRVTKDD